MSFTLPELKLTQKDYHLHGNVKGMVYTSYAAKKGLFGISKGNKDSRFLDDAFFSLTFKNNFLIVKEKTDITGSQRIENFVYDDAHNLKAIALQSTLNVAKLMQPDRDTTYTIKNEFVIESVTIDKWGVVTRHTYFTDKYSVEEIWYDKEDNIRQRKEFLLNDTGRIIKEIIYNIYKDLKNSDPYEFESFYLNVPNQPSEEIEEDAENTDPEMVDGDEYMESYIINNYDSNGFLIETLYYHDDDTIAETVTFKNDAFGNPLYEIYFEDGQITEVRKFTHKYDSNNNWTKRIEYEVERWKKNNIEENESAPIYIVERKFDYEK